MKSLVLYSTVVGGFYAKTDPFEHVINSARAQVGGDTWKRGFSGKQPEGATATAQTLLKEAGIVPVEFEGALTHVAFVENTDNAGNTYPKLRVGLQREGEELLLSVDLKSDVAQRMLTKLDNCQPGDHVRISAWPTTVERGGRQFINHAVSMKNAQGVEVPSNSVFSAEVKKQTDGVEAALAAVGINDKMLVANVKVSKRVAATKALLLTIESRFTPTIPPAP